MFHAINTKCKITNISSKELEPPTKKLITDGDLLIKELSKKQLNTKTSLPEQLNHNKTFLKSTEYVPLVSRLRGTHSTDQIKNESSKFDSIDKLHALGLSDKDIELLNDYQKGIEHVKVKYKNVNENVLLDDINRIKEIVNQTEDTSEDSPQLAMSKQDIHSLLSVKPDSIETKLLKFAIENESKEIPLPHPMDELKNIESNFQNNLDLFSTVNTRKIRKKARTLSNQIKKLNHHYEVQQSVAKVNNKSKNSKWDAVEVTRCESKAPCDKKEYSCRQQKWFTIKEGKIIPVESTLMTTYQDTEADKQQINVEQIKQIDKFKGYDPGVKSSKLYLKNLHRKITSCDINDLLTDIDESSILAVQVMKGKLRGQAFLQFKDESSAEKGLQLLNGKIMFNKPIIAAYSKDIGAK